MAAMVGCSATRGVSETVREGADSSESATASGSVKLGFSELDLSGSDFSNPSLDPDLILLKVLQLVVSAVNSMKESIAICGRSDMYIVDCGAA
jgi:hypothetical protein|tara:strand:- start:6267 stop:6545 length:279 start_codon:yes stop_codon:yes gene_type:complete